MENEIVERLFLAALTFGGVVVTAVLGGVTAYYQWRSKQSMADVNEAVNHRTEKRGEGALSLYDLVWETHEKADELIQWKRGYDGGSFDNGRKVEEYVQETAGRLDAIEASVDRVVDSVSRIKTVCNARHEEGPEQ